MYSISDNKSAMVSYVCEQFWSKQHTTHVYSRYLIVFLKVCFEKKKVIFKESQQTTTKSCRISTTQRVREVVVGTSSVLLFALHYPAETIQGLIRAGWLGMGAFIGLIWAILGENLSSRVVTQWSTNQAATNQPQRLARLVKIFMHNAMNPTIKTANNIGGCQIVRMRKLICTFVVLSLNIHVESFFSFTVWCIDTQVCHCIIDEDKLPASMNNVSDFSAN